MRESLEREVEKFFYEMYNSEGMSFFSWDRERMGEKFCRRYEREKFEWENIYNEVLVKAQVELFEKGSLDFYSGNGKFEESVA